MMSDGTRNKYSRPLRLLMSFFGSLLVHVLLGAIFAAIFKKNKPLFAPSDEA